MSFVKESEGILLDSSQVGVISLQTVSSRTVFACSTPIGSSHYRETGKTETDEQKEREGQERKSERGRVMI